MTDTYYRGDGSGAARDAPVDLPISRQLRFLGRLPWLRHGYMPDWLRARLVSDLPRARRKSVRAVLERLLLTALDDPADAFHLDVAHDGDGERSRLAEWVLRRLARRAPEESPLRDGVVLRFMTGRRPDRLAVPLPPAVGGFLRVDRVGGAAWRPRLAVLGLAAAALVAVGYFVLRNPPPRLPPGAVLRIETGMHIAMINRIGVDAGERFLVTGSDDKTVRVWDPDDGGLLGILRPPIGEGDEGKIYAVALSPDGETVAAGGWTTGTSEPESLYLFDRASGRLVRRIGDLPEVVFHLAFSPNGRRLAAALGGANGIRLFRVRDGQELAQDADYGHDSDWVDFDPQGRLASTCFDGFLRLYDSELSLLAKVEAPGGERPFGIRFSPDGQRLAVGYDDTTRVDVLSGSDLSLLYSPDTGDVSNGDFSKVAWSVDGQFLYAAGMYDDGTGNNPIRRWSDAGKGPYRDLPGAPQTIMDLASLQDGSLVFGAGDPAWGIVTADGKHRVFLGPQIANFSDNREGFLLDATGRVVRFGYQSGGESPATFSLTGRVLTPDPPDDERLRSPRTEAPGLSVESWRNSYQPTLDGEPLELAELEFSRSLAIAPDGQSFLLGAEWNLRSFDLDGEERWKRAAPGAAWAVNLSGDGRLAVAAFADGTIRWYDYADGEELLAFFPHADRRRWVLWTPSGYYDASPDGEELIGWHVNRGPDREAVFYPAEIFRERFYRPDVVDRILETLDEATAVELADAERERR